MADMQSGTKYAVEPQVLTKIAANISKALKYSSLAMQTIPVEQSLQSFSKTYEYIKSESDQGFGFEMDVVSPPDGSDIVEGVDLKTPIVYTNYGMTFNQYLEFQQSKFNLNQRLLDKVQQLALKVDLITYTGDTKHGITALGTATPGTEVTTQLDLTSPTNARLTFATALNQMKAAGKYSGIMNPATNIVIELTPDKFTEAIGVTTATEDNSSMTAVRAVLNEMFPQGNHTIRENPYLDATVVTDGNGKPTITVGTDTCLMYPQHPQVMRILQSAMSIRQSPLDETRGITFQPIQRHTRLDDDNGKALVLVETGLA